MELTIQQLGNVWGIGLMMYCLMKNIERAEWHKFRLFNSGLSARLRSEGPTLGRESDIHAEEGGRSPYTKALKQIIFECLMIKPASRIVVFSS